MTTEAIGPNRSNPSPLWSIVPRAVDHFDAALLEAADAMECAYKDALDLLPEGGVVPPWITRLEHSAAEVRAATGPLRSLIDQIASASVANEALEAVYEAAASYLDLGVRNSDDPDDLAFTQAVRDGLSWINNHMASMGVERQRPSPDVAEGHPSNESERPADEPDVPLKTYDVTIRATVTKTLRVEDEDEEMAIQQAHASFSVLCDDIDEDYKEDCLNVEEVVPTASPRP